MAALHDEYKISFVIWNINFYEKGGSNAGSPAYIFPLVNAAGSHGEELKSVVSSLSVQVRIANEM